MKRSYIIAVVLVITFVLVGYFVSNSFKDTSPATTGTDEKAGQSLDAIIPLGAAAIPGGDKVTIGTNQGTVSVNNFYKIAKGWNGSESTALVIAMTSKYQILYDVSVSAFGIYIVGDLSGPSRSDAEKRFLEITGVSKTDACKLDVTVNIPYGRNLIVGGPYPLSFCSANPQ